MSIIHWVKEYELNIEEIDNQHKKLVDILNSLFSAIREQHTDTEHIDSILQELVSYSKFHFETEEKYMAEHNYQFYSEHVILHEELVGELSEFLIQNGTTEPFDVLKLFKFLKHWLVDHILNEDKKIAQVLSQSKVHS